MDINDQSEANETVLLSFFHRIGQHHQRLLDKLTPFLTARWIFNVLLLVLFMYRVVQLQGFYIIAYVLGIFLLNQFILFLSPVHVADTELDEMGDEDGPTLPTRSNEEFRPFMRRLPEFKFWYTAFRSIVISIICTFFELFDVPVFWPILVIYFITLFLVTMRRQIQHMIRYRYVPFSYGKIRYNQGKPDNNKKTNKN